MVRQDRFRLAGQEVVVLLLLAVVAFLASPPPALAANIVVTTTDGGGIVNNACSLVEALDNANQNMVAHADCLVAGSSSDVDVITFNIPAGLCPGGICTIPTPFSYQVADNVTIDGYTQPGASPNTLMVGSNASIRIVLDGANAVTSSMTISGGNVTVRGLSIGRYTQHGIRFVSGSSSRIFGSFIGVATDGVIARPNGQSGIRVEGTAANLIIGSALPADRNVISGNTNGSGIWLDGGGGHGIWGNYIGTNAAGAASVANKDGIRVASNGGTTLIGGTCPGCGGNLISGNTAGIGIRIDQDGNVRILGNLIGTNAAGTSSLPNLHGIVVSEGSNITIGGRTAAERNIVSGNAQLGIYLGATVASTARVVEGNYVGTGVDGSNVGNGTTGVFVERDTTVGGTAPGAGNVIAFNGNNGVVVNVVNNAISGNAMFSNTGLGIDLGADGVSPNDLADGVGPNRGQNFPVLTRAVVGAQTSVAGTLNTRPNRNYRIELFASPTCDPSGHGEGQTFVASTNVTTDGGGNAAFITAAPSLAVGQLITATATELTFNDTSEFSACQAVQQAGFTLTPVTGPTTETNEGNAFDASFTLRLNSLPVADVTIALSVSDSTEGTIVGPTTLTFSPTNGTTPQTVRLLGVDDDIGDGDVVYAVVTAVAGGADPAYAGLKPPDVAVTNRDNEGFAARCGTRPKVNISVAKAGNGQLRATVTATANLGTQNLIQAITWNRLDTATVALDGVGLVEAGQRTALAAPAQSVSFLISRTPGAPTATVHLTVTDLCGDWPTFVGGGAGAF